MDKPRQADPPFANFALTPIGINNQDIKCCFENGHWRDLHEDFDLRAELEDLEIDSIGHQIASTWCQQLAPQLDRFQL